MYHSRITTDRILLLYVRHVMCHVTYLPFEYLCIGRRTLHTGGHSIASSGRGTFKKFLLSEVLVVNILSEILQILHVSPAREGEGGGEKEGGVNERESAFYN